MDAYQSYRSTATIVFTTDVEWSPEWAIRELFALADSYEIPITPFLTHRSELLGRRLLSDGAARADAGVHPNFLAGSSHGSTTTEVIDTVRAIAPDASCFRAHCFSDDTRTLRALASRGFGYDSNALAFLQPMIAPAVTAAGTLRFPVWWEDDVHSGFGLGWTLDLLRASLDAPGLKIVNVHPLRVALNVPNEKFYEAKRPLYGASDVDPTEHAHVGLGTRTLLEELFRFATSDGRRPHRLREVHQRALDLGVGLQAVTGR